MFTSAIQQQYQALHEKVGLIDCSNYGKLELTGPDARSFLHRLTTQDIQNLPAPQLRYALLLDNKGKIIADLTIWALDNRFLVLTNSSLKERVQQHLQKYLITEEVTIRDCSDDFSVFSLQGPLSVNFLQKLNTVIPSGVFVGQEDPSYFILIPKTLFDSFYNTFYREGKSFGLQTIEPVVQEILRVENGIPLYGKDFSEENTPPEARLFRAISYTKGCYPGQEIVARLKTYGGYRKQLVGLKIDGDLPVGAHCNVPLPLFDHETEIGHITSACYSLKWGATIAMGYVQREYAKEGTPLPIENLTAEVIELPGLPLRDPS
ncbi:MAG: aminomethyl transferase family protein [Candidatus Omnitrophica bacterium]|nr:aminomethyl transferase family protein [Candidatus Omnitrophota bacterium]